MRKALLHIGVFAGTIAALWLLLLLAAGIPNENIRGNMEKSALSYRDKDAYEFTRGARYNAVADNYADVILLGVLWNMGNGDPLSASLDTRYYDGGEYGESYGLYLSLYGEKPNTDYTRYWHGSAALIRPLLLFTDVEGIKLAGFAGILILTVLNIVLLFRKKAGFAAVGLVLSLLGVQIWNVRLSLEYIPPFLVALLMCLLFLMTEKKGNTPLTLLSVVCGAAIAFFDFLTAETVTILLPLLMVFLIRGQEERLGQRKENLLLTVKCLLAWGISYGMTFLVKWCAASAVLGENKIADALASAGRRVYANETEEHVTALQQLLYAIPANLSALFGGERRVAAGNILVGSLAVLAIAGGVWYLFRAKRACRDISVLLLILGAAPYLRYLVLSDHSYLHAFFTYRAQCVSILALYGIVWFHIRLPWRREGHSGRKYEARRTERTTGRRCKKHG